VATMTLLACTLAVLLIVAGVQGLIVRFA